MPPFLVLHPLWARIRWLSLPAGNSSLSLGSTPYDPATGKIESGSISQQTQLVLENIKNVLSAGGVSLANVVSCRVYLSSLTPESFKEMNEVYLRYFGESKPARATIGAQLLGFDVEIECVAVLD